ncbi:MAG: C25 family cysteine peptidase [Oscillospiraceae bacterium]|jgi:hypothetical protein|nr:C25 family cysteine peptidase [Oscillospiraceae bacterium]
MENTKIITYNLGELTTQYEPFGEKNIYGFSLVNAGSTATPGQPMLPRESMLVALPDGAIVKDISAKVIKSDKLNDQFQVICVPNPATEDEPLTFTPDSAIYSSDTDFPSILTENAGQESFYGINCVNILVYPVVWNPKSKLITLHREIEITITYNLDGATNVKQKKSQLPKYLKHLVYGLAEYEEPFADNGKPRLLIVTSKELVGALQEYVLAKSDKYTVDTVFIENMAPEPASRVDDLYNFLKSENETNKISHVVICGDVDTIPTKMFIKNGEEFASDSFYASDFERGQYKPEFCVSRIPSSTEDELRRLCRRAADYSLNYSEKRKQTVFTTYYSSENNGDRYNICSDGIVEYIKNHNAGQFAPTKRDDTDKPEDIPPTKQALISTIEVGPGFINYRGHGDFDRWQSHIGLTTNDVINLNIKKDLPNVFSIACYNNAIQNQGAARFGAAWIQNERAITFLGASSPSYTIENNYFNKFLWEELCAGNTSVIGAIYQAATIKFLAEFPNDDYVQHNVKSYLLLGDGTTDYLDNPANNV